MVPTAKAKGIIYFISECNNSVTIMLLKLKYTYVILVIVSR